MRKIIKSIIPESLKTRYRDFRRNQRNKKREAILNGNDVFCPVCESSFKIFGTFGLLKRVNAMCYNCGTLERHRLLYLYLSEKLDLFKNTNKPIRLLHFAPEKVFYNIFSAKKNISYVPCDLFPAVYDYKGEVKITKVDITKIPFEDNYFDLIVCSHVLEHIPDDRLAMSELYRVLKKDGFGILQVPIDYNREKTYEDDTIVTPEAREAAYGQHDHVRYYGRDYPERLKSVGFKVFEDDFVNSFSKEDIFKFGLDKEEITYKCVK